MKKLEMRMLLVSLTIVLTASAARATEYHVSKAGSDANPGTATRPLETISAAAAVARPGDTVTVHEGVYREHVNPPRGGESDARRIVYQAAPGEKVVIKGSEIIKDWKQVDKETWKVTLPNSFFGNYNPYTDIIQGEWHAHRGYPRHTGTVYVNGHWLDEAQFLEQVKPSPQSAGNRGTGVKEEVLGGTTAGYQGKPIEGTEEDILYQSCRYNLAGYRLAVPDGTYTVTLKFCEPHFDAPAKRVFEVKLQDKVVLDEFDIFAKAGKFAAHDETFKGITVTDGQLKIDIVNRVSMACISGIVLTGGDHTRKINCGGPVWNGYGRDPAVAGSIGPVVDDARPFWKAEVDDENTTIWVRFGGIDPNEELVEINVRRSVFYPDRPGRDYITVRGFTMRHAATPWSGAMSEQIGLIGTHWSKGWIIENNVISHSMNTGITLGRYDLGRFGIALPAETAPGFVESCRLALKHGWSKEKIGSHIVRNNHISHCEKNGIHGSLGGIFCTIEGNAIHDIAVRGWIGGPDVAGLKLLGSQDVIIRGNHFYRCDGVGGVWLDWMAQGTRFSGNLLHDNSRDLFVEVNHGPLLIDNNVFLSRGGLLESGGGGAYAHNLFACKIHLRSETRKTPFHVPHGTRILGLATPVGDDERFHNNVFAGYEGLAPYDAWKAVRLQAVGNVYLAGAEPSNRDREALVDATLEPDIAVEETPDGWWLVFKVDPAWQSKQRRSVVETKTLGKAHVSNAPYERPDGKPYRIDTDYFGGKRATENPAPGPFELPAEKVLRLKVWPKTPVE